MNAMTTVYWFCAVVGGTVLVLQFLMTMVGLGGDHGDTDGGHDMADGGHDVGDASHESPGHASTTWLFGVLSFRTIVAGLAFFGLTGLGLSNNTNLETPFVVLGAVAAGLAAIVVVNSVMRSLSRLNADGTVRIQSALGSTGTVYLPIPGEKSGVGKVHVLVQGRKIEYKAVTAQEGLSTGASVVVVGVIGDDTVEVSLAESLHQVQA